MGQMQKQFRILNEQTERFIRGEIDAENLKQIISSVRAGKEMITETRKCLQAAQEIRGFAKAMDKIEVVGKEAIFSSVEEKEIEMIKCPNTGQQKTRAECLSYSGNHDDGCVSCEHRAETVQRLIPT